MVEPLVEDDPEFISQKQKLSQKKVTSAVSPQKNECDGKQKTLTAMCSSSVSEGRSRERDVETRDTTDCPVLPCICCPNILHSKYQHYCQQSTVYSSWVIPKLLNPCPVMWWKTYSTCGSGVTVTRGTHCSCRITHVNSTRAPEVAAIQYPLAVQKVINHSLQQMEGCTGPLVTMDVMGSGLMTWLWETVTYQHSLPWCDNVISLFLQYQGEVYFISIIMNITQRENIMYCSIGHGFLWKGMPIKWVAFFLHVSEFYHALWYVWQHQNWLCMQKSIFTCV